MDKYIVTEDMKLFYVPATSFPEGIMDAFETLHKMLPSIEGRTFFGISQPSEKGNIVYKAAVLASYDGEAEKYNCDTFIITKGEYLTETIKDWQKNIPTIGTTFQALIANPRLDMNFPCVEWYKDDDELMCMVRIDPSKE